MAPLKKALQAVNPSAYTFHVPETTGNLDWRPELYVADNRRPAVFFRPLTVHNRQWSGHGEGAFAHAGFHIRRYANLVMCPATPIGVGGRVLKPVCGGRTMLRRTFARPEQSPPPNSLTERFPLFEYAGRTAAELWILGAPLSVGEWRDLRYRNLIAGDTVFAGDVARRQAFNDAFAQEIALSIARQSRAEVRHG